MFIYQILAKLPLGNEGGAYKIAFRRVEVISEEGVEAFSKARRLLDKDSEVPNRGGEWRLSVLSTERDFGFRRDRNV